MKPLTATGKFEMVKRVIQRVNKILFHAIHAGLIHANPAANISKAFEKTKVKHHPSISPEELPELMKTLQVASVNLQTRLVIELQLLTITRLSEASGTK
ncbi:hypothetical protein SAMN02583745_00222 [Thorsellia anophelis DSM 18579]|uniref:Uncharacterized protein n=2 Tax=Thorsellia anophelis TaxID=336804 RepID=A0A1H9YFX3_9GAMM|nr:hypothetical protein [Thorsellia anophelis]SES67468.1 hypothetical protein SAMN02583745_00222 [Thorsellia anophelis DSM 18579]